MSFDYVRHLSCEIRFGGSSVWQRWQLLWSEGDRDLVNPVAGQSVSVGFSRRDDRTCVVLSARDAFNDWIQICRHADGEIVTGWAFYHFSFCWLFSTEGRKTRGR